MADGRNGKGVEALAITVDASKDEFESLPGDTLAAKIERAVHSQRCGCALWRLPGPLSLGVQGIGQGALHGGGALSPTWCRSTPAHAACPAPLPPALQGGRVWPEHLPVSAAAVA